MVNGFNQSSAFKIFDFSSLTLSHHIKCYDDFLVINNSGFNQVFSFKDLFSGDVKELCFIESHEPLTNFLFFASDGILCFVNKIVYLNPFKQNQNPSNFHICIIDLEKGIRLSTVPLSPQAIDHIYSISSVKRDTNGYKISFVNNFNYILFTVSQYLLSYNSKFIFLDEYIKGMPALSILQLDNHNPFSLDFITSFQNIDFYNLSTYCPEKRQYFTYGICLESNKLERFKLYFSKNINIFNKYNVMELSENIKGIPLNNHFNLINC